MKCIFPLASLYMAAGKTGLHKSNIPVVYVIVVTTAIDSNIKTGSNKKHNPLDNPSGKQKE